MTWPTRDMFALTVDGKILMNARALDDADIAALAARKTGVFVGVVLTTREARELSERIYDATSEAAAHFVGSRRRRGRKK